MFILLCCLISKYEYVIGILSNEFCGPCKRTPMSICSVMLRVRYGKYIYNYISFEPWTIRLPIMCCIVFIGLAVAAHIYAIIVYLNRKRFSRTLQAKNDLFSALFTCTLYAYWRTTMKTTKTRSPTNKFTQYKSTWGISLW